MSTPYCVVTIEEGDLTAFGPMDEDEARGLARTLRSANVLDESVVRVVELLPYPPR